MLYGYALPFRIADWEKKLTISNLEVIHWWWSAEPQKSQPKDKTRLRDHKAVASWQRKSLLMSPIYTQIALSPAFWSPEQIRAWAWEAKIFHDPQHPSFDHCFSLIYMSWTHVGWWVSCISPSRLSQRDESILTRCSLSHCICTMHYYAVVMWQVTARISQPPSVVCLELRAI